MRLWLRGSLRGRLLAFILLAVILSGVMQSLIAYQNALHETDEIFDFQMQQIALSLRSGLPNNASFGRPIDGIDDENFAFVIQVFEANGERSFQSNPYVDLLRQAESGFSLVDVPGTRFRVFSLESGARHIQISQDVAARELMARNLAWRTVGPIVLLVPLLMFAVWWTVNTSLAPVDRLRRQLSKRAADDTGKLDLYGLPREIAPLGEELNLLLTRIEDAFEAQQVFVSDAAHELRSPLAALKLQAKGLRRAREPEAQETALNRLDSGIDRATRMVEQLLTLARQESSAHLNARSEPVRIGELVQTALSDLVALVEDKHLDISLLDTEDAYILGDQTQLNILIRNVLDNAIKYNVDGGRIAVSILKRQDSVTLMIDDSGAGIPESDYERVFDRFYRVAGEHAIGSGLGLSIVQTIAKEHSATVWLERSDSLGGLKVSIRFQLR